jgi:CBS domain-containing protein
MEEKELTEITAAEIMSRDLAVITPLEKVTTAEITMIKNNIGGLPVVAPNTNKILGIITQRDIQLSRAVIGTAVFHVDDLYSKNPVTARKTDKIPDIIKKMRDNDIERIPIVNELNQVEGIIVHADIIKILGKVFEKKGLI